MAVSQPVLETSGLDSFFSPLLKQI